MSHVRAHAVAAMQHPRRRSRSRRRTTSAVTQSRSTSVALRPQQTTQEDAGKLAGALRRADSDENLDPDQPKGS